MASQTKNDDNKYNYFPNIGDSNDDCNYGNPYQMKRNKNYFPNVGDSNDDINDFWCDRGYGLAIGAAIGDGIAIAYGALVKDGLTVEDGIAIKAMYITDSFGQVSNVTKQAIEVGSQLCSKLCSNPPSIYSMIVDTPVTCPLTSCMPLILYGSKLSDDNLYHLLKMYAQKTDKDDIILVINASYAIMAKYLLRCPENKKDRHIHAIIKMITWLKKTGEYTLIKWLQVMNEDNNINTRHLFKLLKSKDISRKWLQVIQEPNDDTDERVYIYKLAFLQCCYHLLQNSSYYDAILSVVKEGGYIAMNACLVGGMNGVLNGLYNLNSLYVQKIEAKKYYKMKIIQTLLKYAPHDVSFDLKMQNQGGETSQEHAYGLVIGAAIGDSCGSYCEFSNTKLSPMELDEAMKLPGGGTWGEEVISGQVTDDTELAISLSYGLCAMEKNPFDQTLIALEYQTWTNSDPFDQGNCTKHVLQFAPNVVAMKRAAIDYDTQIAKQYKSVGNLANGSLMRCMPLILYGSRLSEDKLYLLMKFDAELTHHNEFIFLVNTCYAIMVIYLLKHRNANNKHRKAYKKMVKWLTEKSKQSVNASVILSEWLEFVDANDLDKLQTATKLSGFVKIAFQRVCFHLLQNHSFYEAIKSVVGEGGDSDTNACIVGGIMGALHGLNGIPNEYVQKIQNCVPTRAIRDRFQAKWYFKRKMVETLMNNAPTDEIFHFVDYPLKK